jgi:hypothetical protein
MLVTVACRANIANPITTLKAWAGLIEADFSRRNYMFVQLEDLKRTLGEAGFECDTRSLSGFIALRRKPTRGNIHRILQARGKERMNHWS